MDAPVNFRRLPRHVGLIPDGNRRWADARGLPRSRGYAEGIEPGLRLLDICRQVGIDEVSVYGFTKENVRRPAEQVEAFRQACSEFAHRVVRAGAAFRAVGDTRSAVFPADLVSYSAARSDGDIRVNLLVNYGWQWDLLASRSRAGDDYQAGRSEVRSLLASGDIPRVDLVIRWGGRRRLSGFLPVQCAYADFHVMDTLWPDSSPEEFIDALAWYQEQDVTLGG